MDLFCSIESLRLPLAGSEQLPMNLSSSSISGSPGPGLVPAIYTNLSCPYRRDLRRRTIDLFDALPRVRVRPPLAGTPVGLTGCRPPLVRPSPPPCGLSIGFIAVPRTYGRIPFQRLRPALPITTFIASALPTWPIVARHPAGTRRISPLGSVIWAQSASRAMSVALEPAD